MADRAGLTPLHWAAKEGKKEEASGVGGGLLDAVLIAMIQNQSGAHWARLRSISVLDLDAACVVVFLFGSCIWGLICSHMW